MKTIPGFPDYQITKDGRVWSKPRISLQGNKLKGLWLKPETIKGYFRVVLCKNNKPHKRFIHRLVLETYVGSCPKGMEGCHNNGNQKDNQLGNLRWDTRSNNQQDSIRHGTFARGEKRGMANLTEAKVRVIRYLRNVAKFSGNDLAWQFNTTRSNIYAICNRHSWKHIDG